MPKARARGARQEIVLGVPEFNIRRSERLRQKREGPTDRLSNLPVHIAHQILTFLPTEDVVRTSALSKKWLAIWWTYHIQDFDETRYARLDDRFVVRYEFLNSMIDPLYRGIFMPDRPTVQKLRVSLIFETDFFLQAFIDAYIRLCLANSKLVDLFLALETGYYIEHNDTYPDALYSVPEMLFTLAGSLASMFLQACECSPIEKASMPSLRRLHMKYTCIDEDSLSLLVAGCPTLEDLDLEFCFGFDSVRVSSPGLRTFNLSTCEDLDEVEMDVPSLISFAFLGSPYNSDPDPDPESDDNFEECAEIVEFSSPKGSEGFRSLETVTLSHLRMNRWAAAAMMALFKGLVSATLVRCSLEAVPLRFSPRLANAEVWSCEYEDIELESEALESVTIVSHAVPGKHVFGGPGTDRFSRLRLVTIGGLVSFPDRRFVFTSGPFLEAMVLEACPGLSDIRLTSESLKTLVIVQCRELLRASIVTPSLESLKFVGPLIDFCPMEFAEEARVELDLLSPDLMENDYDYHQKLWFFLKSFERAKFISIYTEFAEFIITPIGSKFRPPICFPEELKVKADVGAMRLWNYLLHMLNFSICFKTLHLDYNNRKLVLKFAEPSDMSHFESRKKNIGATALDCLGHLEKVTLLNYNGSAGDKELISHLLAAAINLKTMEFDFEDYELKCYAEEMLRDFLECFLVKTPENVVYKYLVAGEEI